MKICDQFKDGRPNLSFEIFPPKHDDALGDISQVLDVLCDLHPDYISVTNGASSGQNGEKTIALSKMIRDNYGVEPLVHLTGWGRSKDDVDAFASALCNNGLYNVLALRGDKIADGSMVSIRSATQPQTRPDGGHFPNRGTSAVSDDFPHASNLIEYMSNWGMLAPMSGSPSACRESNGCIEVRNDGGEDASVFCVAAACYPDSHPEAASPEADIAYTVKKQQCGAKFLISQLFFDNDNYVRFMGQLKEKNITVPVCAGIMPVVNKAQIKRMIGMCGASLPVRFQRIVDKYGDDKTAMLDVGIQYAIAQVIDLCARGYEYIHLYTMNNPTVARRICEGVKNVIRR